MAHFAKVEEKQDPTGFTSDTHLIVTEVYVVANDIPTAAGPLGENDMHVDGETWCNNRWGGSWKQTSYNNNFRGLYAGLGYRWNPDINRFVPPQPYSSWTYNSSTHEWDAPVTYPAAYQFTNDAGETHYYCAIWSEENLRWEAHPEMSENTIVDRYWDPSSSTWIDI